MGTENIRIKVTREGAKAAGDDIGRIGDKARGASSALDGLGSALKAAVAGAGVRETIRIADGYTDLSNKVRFATKSEQEMVAVRRELFKNANQDRSDIDAMADTYGKLRLSTKSLGLSQREVIDLTDTLTKATIV